MPNTPLRGMTLLEDPMGHTCEASLEGTDVVAAHHSSSPSTLMDDIGTGRNL